MNPNPYINEDLQALAETVRRFAQEKVAPGFLERDKTRVLDRALLAIQGPEAAEVMAQHEPALLSLIHI